MRAKDCGFNTCDQKGFHVTFENGWTVSVQFGRGNYGGNHDYDGEYDDKMPHASTAEVAAWPNGGELTALDGGDTVLAYQTPAQVLAVMNDIAARPA